MGLDVSHHNDRINWTRVKAAGNAFVFIKATQGLTYVDPMFKANWLAAGAAGLARGAYHYMESGKGGQDQASALMAAVASVGGLKDSDIGYALDFEDRPGVQAHGSEASVQEAVLFLERVRVRGRRNPVVYLDRDMATIDALGRLGAYHLWLADYSGGEAPHLPRQWTDWAFWQYTDKGTCDGVNGAGTVDLDRFRLGPDGLADWIARTRIVA